MSKRKTLVLSGYYGFDNAGDEAILFSILQELEAHNFNAIVLSGNPTKTSATYGVEAVNRMNVIEVSKAIRQSDGVISGGGSLLQDITSSRSVIYYSGVMKIAQFFNKPVFCYAQGVGPLQRKWLFPFIRQTLNRCTLLSVRDQESKKTLEKIGINKPIELSADPVLGLRMDLNNQLPNKLVSFLDKSPIVISARPWKNHDEVVDKMSTLVESLLDKQIPVLLLPFHYPHDVSLSKNIEQKVRNSNLLCVVEEELAMADFVYIIKQSRLMIGMRLHSLIFAASQGIPFVGISYDPKIDAFMDLYSLKSSTNTDDWNLNQILLDVDSILSFEEKSVKMIKEKTIELNERIHLPITYIDKFFEEEHT